MRQILLVIGALVLAVSLLVGFSVLSQVNREQIELTARLQSRSQVLADSLAESIGSSYNARATSTTQRIIDKFVSNERLAGLGVFDNVGSIVATSKDLPLMDDSTFITTVMDSDESQGDFVRKDGETYYVQVTPLHDDNERVVGALVVAQNATYIDEGIRGIWQRTLSVFFRSSFFSPAPFLSWSDGFFSVRYRSSSNHCEQSAKAIQVARYRAQASSSRS